MQGLPSVTEQICGFGYSKIPFSVLPLEEQGRQDSSQRQWYMAPAAAPVLTNLLWCFPVMLMLPLPQATSSSTATPLSTLLSRFSQPLNL